MKLIQELLDLQKAKVDEQNRKVRPAYKKAYKKSEKKHAAVYRKLAE